MTQYELKQTKVEDLGFVTTVNHGQVESLCHLDRILGDTSHPGEAVDGVQKYIIEHPTKSREPAVTVTVRHSEGTWGDVTIEGVKGGRHLHDPRALRGALEVLVGYNEMDGANVHVNSVSKNLVKRALGTKALKDAKIGAIHAPVAPSRNW